MLDAASLLQGVEPDPFAVRVELVAPLGGALEVADPVARADQVAARPPGEGLIAELTRHCCSCGGVEHPHAVVDVASDDLHESLLGPAEQLEVGVPEGLADLHHLGRLLLGEVGVGGLHGEVGLPHRDQAVLGTEVETGQGAAGQLQPSPRHRLLPVERCVVEGQRGGEPGGTAQVTFVAVGAIGLFADLDRVRMIGPEVRQAEGLQHRRAAVGVGGRLEVGARGRPVESVESSKAGIKVGAVAHLTRHATSDVDSLGPPE